MASKNINEMEYSRRRKICEMFDPGHEWKLIAEEIGLSVDKIQLLEMSKLRPGGSPTSEVLNIWSQRNGTVEMLASLLLRLHLQRAAEMLRGIVPDEMFNTNELTNWNRHIRNVPEERSLPKPSQAVTEFALPPPSSAQNGMFDHKRPQENVIYNRETTQPQKSKQKLNIAIQNSSKSSPSRPLDTWSENMSPEIGFYPPSLPSQASSVFRRIPEESPDVSGSIPNFDSPKKNVLPKQNSGDGDIALSNFIICHRYDDIVAATNNFDDENLLGRGGFGVVYRGSIRKTTFAIKVLQRKQNPASCRDFLAELNSLVKYRQKNIITLCGCSIDGPAICLVYEYMVNGSLQDQLDCKNGKPLSWKTRHSILKDAAAGIQYLHTVDVPLIHGDIKSGNILLGAHFEAKISDFGLAKEATGGAVTGKLTHVTRNQLENVYGSRAYLPEEFFTSGFQFNIKTDTYSFGIVIFETCTGEKPEDPRREGGRLLGDYVRNIMLNNRSHALTIKDKKLLGWPDDLWLALMNLAWSCTADTKKERPLMTEVYGRLETLHQEMQLKYKAESRNGSLQPPSLVGSEKSYHLSHQSSAHRNQSLAAENTLPMDGMFSPLDLQKVYDYDKNTGCLVKEKAAISVDVGVSNSAAMRHMHEGFAEFSLAEDGSKIKSVPSKSKHAVVSDDRESYKLSKGSNTTSSINLPTDEIDPYCVGSSQMNCFDGFKKGNALPSESLQNFENEQLEGCLEDTPSSLFLKWHKEDRCKEFEETASDKAMCHSNMVLTEELEKMKKKKFPGFLDSVRDENSERNISVDITALKKKTLPDYENVFGNSVTQNCTQNDAKSLTEQSDSKDGCPPDVSALPEHGAIFYHPCYPPNTTFSKNVCSMEEVPSMYSFYPPESSSEEESDSSTSYMKQNDSERRARPVHIAKEDLLRSAKLEQLKRQRQELK